MLKAVFYTRFHSERGRSVVHQYPPDSIMASPSATDHQGDKTLVNFSDISAYIIPPYELCNRALSICSNKHRVLGFPISVQDADYARNRFTFNVCFVLEEDEEISVWTQVVRKTAMFFKALQENDDLLQEEESLAGIVWAGDEGYPARDVGMVYKLLESIWGDLNEYAEACVRVSEFHVLNLRLAEPRPMPPKVQLWDVPLLIRSLPTPEQWTWELTLQKAYTHIDGVKHVQRIAELADAEVKLVKRAVRELLYHDRAILLDIFHFQAIYAQTSDFAWFVGDEEMQDECCRYVAVSPKKNFIVVPPTQEADTALLDETPSKKQLVSLYGSLTPGQNIQDYVLTHQTQLSNIDIRRFITFGIIKGFLRRIHKYALAGDYAFSSAQKHSGSSNNSSPTKSKTSGRAVDDRVKRELDRAWKKAALSSGWATPPQEPHLKASLAKSARSLQEVRSEDDEKLREYLDGQCCMDQICVEMKCGERKIVESLKSGRIAERYDELTPSCRDPQRTGGGQAWARLQELSVEFHTALERSKRSAQHEVERIFGLAAVGTFGRAQDGVGASRR
nr:nitrogen permease regulator 2 like [Quercus suber]